MTIALHLRHSTISRQPGARQWILFRVYCSGLTPRFSTKRSLAEHCLYIPITALVIASKWSGLLVVVGSQARTRRLQREGRHVAFHFVYLIHYLWGKSRLSRFHAQPTAISAILDFLRRSIVIVLTMLGIPFEMGYEWPQFGQIMLPSSM